MFKIGEVIDGKYRVDGVCSDTGGMGTILSITPLKEIPYRVVLKYCKSADEEQLNRFRREVRLLSTFEGSARVVQVVDRNLEHDPPYFVMKYYPDGDLSGKATEIRESQEVQERLFVAMIDCIQEIHSQEKFHRDIKPQNFLLDGDAIVVSDFGLAMELGSHTAFTRSSMFWGTPGYMPPEFYDGGFKHADASGDIFMLGKTMYSLVTGRDPTYIIADGIPAPLLHVIEHCCRIPKAQRYQTLAELKQSLVGAYDVLLGRGGGLAIIKQLLATIAERIDRDGQYRADEIAQFVERLSIADAMDQLAICREVPTTFYSIIGQPPVVDHLGSFLDIYERLVKGQDYGFGYAETIASNMRQVFSTEGVPAVLRARALDLAILAAYYMNRFAAMDTCTAMITGVEDEALGLEVAHLIERHSDTFVANIKREDCRNASIRTALERVRAGKN